MRKLIAFFSVLLSLQSFSWAASFDCAKARTPMEKLVCSDEELSRLDEELAAAYKQALASSGLKEVLKKWQRDWIRSVSNVNDPSRLMQAYTERLDLLYSVAPPSDPAFRWSGKYVGLENGVENDDRTLLLVGLSGSRVYILGDATYVYGSIDQGEVNVGEIDCVGVLEGKKLSFDDGDYCSGVLVLSADGLEVEEDGGGCGGAGVTFLGNYRRQ